MQMTDVSAFRNVDVKVGLQSDLTVAKTATVRARGGRFETPTRSLTWSAARFSESRALAGERGRGLNEVFRHVDSRDVDVFASDLSAQRDFQARLFAGAASSKIQDEVMLTLFSLDKRKPKGGWRPWIPTDSQLDYLVHFLAGVPYNNLVIPPIIREVSGEDYLAFLRRFFERLPSFSSLTVAGLVPNLSHREVSAILEFYRDQGVSSYVLDFQGRTPLSNWALLPVFGSHLWKVSRDIGPHFAHAFNVRYGMGRDKSQLVPARDLLLLLECFDSFGALHTPPPINSEFRKKIQSGKVPPPRPRVLDPKEYGYRQLTKPSSEIEDATKKAGLGKAFEAAGSDYEPPARVCKVLNAALALREAQALGTKIADRAEIHYLGGKPSVSGELARLKEIRQSYAAQFQTSSIDDFI